MIFFAFVGLCMTLLVGGTIKNAGLFDCLNSLVPSLLYWHFIVTHVSEAGITLLFFVWFLALFFVLLCLAQVNGGQLNFIGDLTICNCIVTFLAMLCAGSNISKKIEGLTVLDFEWGIWGFLLVVFIGISLVSVIVYGIQLWEQKSNGEAHTEPAVAIEQAKAEEEKEYLAPNHELTALEHNRQAREKAERLQRIQEMKQKTLDNHNRKLDQFIAFSREFTVWDPKAPFGEDGQRLFIRVQFRNDFKTYVYTYDYQSVRIGSEVLVPLIKGGSAVGVVIGWFTCKLSDMKYPATWYKEASNEIGDRKAAVLADGKTKEDGKKFMAKIKAATEQDKSLFSKF